MTGNGRVGLVAVAALLFTAAMGARAEAVESLGDPSQAIVKIYATFVGRDVTSPWRPGWTLSKTGSGALIGGGRILTAAHVVDDQTFVLVRRNGTARKVQARVLFVSHVADLALLQVAEPEFDRGVAPLELGELPAVRDGVAAFGFPNGGETLSITEGVVARAEHWQYVHGQESLLAIQMDAAIDPGSSGGPLLRQGRVVGVAMQGFKDSAIGCAVPAPLIRQFLEDAADGRVDGIPELGLEWQKLESAALKASLGVPSATTGVLLTTVDASPGGGELRAGDVLLALAGRAVADDGTVELRQGERTDFHHVTDVMPIGSKVSVRFLRDGAVHEAALVLSRARGEGNLVPRLFDRNADYFIFGGLAFVNLSRNLLDTAKEWIPAQLFASLQAQADREATRPGDGLVVVASILSSDVNAGYEDAQWKAVRSVDGRDVSGLSELVSLVEGSDRPFVSFGLADGARITLDRPRAVATAEEVLSRYEVGADRSAGLKAAAVSERAGEVATLAAGPHAHEPNRAGQQGEQ